MLTTRGPLPREIMAYREFYVVHSTRTHPAKVCVMTRLRLTFGIDGMILGVHVDLYVIRNGKDFTLDFNKPVVCGDRIAHNQPFVVTL